MVTSAASLRARQTDGGEIDGLVLLHEHVPWERRQPGSVHHRSGRPLLGVSHRGYRRDGERKRPYTCRAEHQTLLKEASGGSTGMATRTAHALASGLCVAGFRRSLRLSRFPKKGCGPAVNEKPPVTSKTTLSRWRPD